MEKLQIAAARVVTGIISYSSKHLLYHDTGCDHLSTRRENQRLILFFKIINGLAPPHLCRLLDTYQIGNQRYDFRSPTSLLPFQEPKLIDVHSFLVISAPGIH